MKTLAIASAILVSFGASAAKLEIDDSIKIISINGEAPMMQGNIIKLQPGLQQLQVQYGEIFNDNFVNPDYVRSGVHTVKFEVEGEQYHLSAPENMSYNDALEFAANPDFNVNRNYDHMVAFKSIPSDDLMARSEVKIGTNSFDDYTYTSKVVAYEGVGKLSFESADPLKTTF